MKFKDYLQEDEYDDFDVFIVKANKATSKLTRALKKEGFKIASASPADYDVDAEITLGSPYKEYSIQITADKYPQFIVIHFADGKMRELGLYNNSSYLLRELASLLRKEIT